MAVLMDIKQLVAKDTWMVVNIPACPSKLNVWETLLRP